MIDIKKIFVDCDGTLFDPISKIVSLYNEDYRYYKGFEYVDWIDIETWNFEECKLATKEVIDNYFNQPRFFKNLEFMENANEYIRFLEEDYETIFVSMGGFPNLELKKKWLASHLGQEYADSFIGCDFERHEDKAHVDMSGGIFIDDSANNLITSNADIKICYGDVYEWNKEWKGQRCFNWREVDEYIRKVA